MSAQRLGRVVRFRQQCGVHLASTGIRAHTNPAQGRILKPCLGPMNPGMDPTRSPRPRACVERGKCLLRCRFGDTGRAATASASYGGRSMCAGRIACYDSRIPGRAARLRRRRMIEMPGKAACSGLMRVLRLDLAGRSGEAANRRSCVIGGRGLGFRRDGAICCSCASRAAAGDRDRLERSGPIYWLRLNSRLSLSLS
jgi:hypothetical protein